MLKSMTAFSRRETVCKFGSLVWELRSVNHRYLDLSIRLPEELRSIEPQVRDQINNKLSRGKVEASLRFKPIAAADAQLIVNESLAQQVAAAAIKVQELLTDAAPVSPVDVLRWPGVFGQADTDLRPLQSATLILLKEVIEDYLATRGREGEKTATMLSERCDAMSEIVGKIRVLRPLALERQRKKLLSRIEELSVESDNGRLEQELVFIAQRLDVDEELDRLTAHIGELKHVLKRTDPVGRRLDFLLQEFNREANTLSSKSADTETTALTVDLKVLIEQMREQVQNIE